LKHGQENWKKGQHEKSLKKLQKGRARLQQWRLHCPDMNFQLALAMSHFAEKRPEACEFLRRELDIQCRANPTSKRVLELCNALTEAYHQSGLWREAAMQAEWTTRTYSGSCHSNELKMASFYFIDSNAFLGTYSGWDQLKFRQVYNLSSLDDLDGSYYKACYHRVVGFMCQEFMNIFSCSYQECYEHVSPHYSQSILFGICADKLGSYNLHQYWSYRGSEQYLHLKPLDKN